MTSLSTELEGDIGDTQIETEGPVQLDVTMGWVPNAGSGEGVELSRLVKLSASIGSLMI